MNKQNNKKQTVTSLDHLSTSQTGRQNLLFILVSLCGSFFFALRCAKDDYHRAGRKLANVMPIYKKGSCSSVGNYRPVGLTSVCCKVLEKLVRNALLSHMTDNGIVSDYQHGFVHGRSCSTQLLMVTDKWTEILDQGGVVDTVYLDFAKAFNTVHICI